MNENRLVWAMDIVIFEAVKLALSLAVLAWAAYLAIKSVGSLMELIGISEASAGFVFLALMTTLPEITVAIFSIYEGVPGVSVGDILGSHIFNICFVLGILAVTGAFKKIEKEPFMELLDILFLASVIPVFLVIFWGAGRIIGVVLLGVFAFSLYNMAKRKSPTSMGSRIRVQKKKLKLMILVILSTAVTFVAAYFAVSSTSEIIRIVGILPVVIGAKIVAIGTSLPELAFGFAATKARRPYFVLGDVIGANLTTITLALGLVLIASPFTIDPARFAEIIFFVTISNFILWRYLVKGHISPVGGIFLVIVYVLFQAVLE